MCDMVLNAVEDFLKLKACVEVRGRTGSTMPRKLHNNIEICNAGTFSCEKPPKECTQTKWYE
jgi:hypothetical protein